MVSKQVIQQRLAQFQDVAKKAGVKLTHQRLEIFRVVASSEEHPSAEAVYNEVREYMPTVSLDTVYRTLWLLTDLGLLATVAPRESSMRFDANLTHHHHFRCVRCGLLRDFDSDELDALSVPDAVKRFGQVVSTNVEIRGICPECAKASDETR